MHAGRGGGIVRRPRGGDRSSSPRGLRLLQSNMSLCYSWLACAARDSEFGSSSSLFASPAERGHIFSYFVICSHRDMLVNTVTVAAGILLVSPRALKVRS